MEMWGKGGGVARFRRAAGEEEKVGTVGVGRGRGGGRDEGRSRRQREKRCQRKQALWRSSRGGGPGRPQEVGRRQVAARAELEGARAASAPQ